MDRLGSLEVFVAVAEAGGFSRAAARLNLSPPVVTRAVAALEGRLGVALFQRSTRRVRPTEAGIRFLEQARRLLTDLELAEHAARGTGAEPTGHLSVTAPVTFGRLHVAPVLADLLKRRRGLSASLTGLDRVVNLIEEGHDAAVRIGALAESSLIARRIGEVRRVLVASPDYLERHAAPAMPRDLEHHALIAFGTGSGLAWRFRQGGTPVAIDVAPRLAVNDAMAALALAEAGEGITMVLSYQAAEGLARGKLRLVLEEFATPAEPVHIVYPPTRMVAAKLRAFIDFAAPALAARLAAIAAQFTARPANASPASTPTTTPPP